MLHRQGDVVLNSQSPADNAILLENKIFTLKTSAAITTDMGSILSPLKCQMLNDRFRRVHESHFQAICLSDQWL